MKVLKIGRKQSGWAGEFTCDGRGNGSGGCGALLLVERDDLFYTTRHYRDETDYFVTFKCSECGVLTDINDIFPGLLRELPSLKEWEKTQK